MLYYPLFFDLKERPCVVVGGGAVSERKVLNLVDAGALVTVVSPRLTPVLKGLRDGGALTHLPKRFAPEDIEGAFLVFAASCKRDVNERVAASASRLGLPVNVADDPDGSSFIVPSLLKRDKLQVAVSTSALSPFLSRHLRETLEEIIGPEYGALTEIMGAVRNKLLKNKQKSVNFNRIYADILNSDIVYWIADGKRAKINALLTGLLGSGYTLSMLGVKLEN